MDESVRPNAHLNIQAPAIEGPSYEELIERWKRNTRSAKRKFYCKITFAILGYIILFPILMVIGTIVCGWYAGVILTFCVGWDDEDTRDNCVGRNFEKCIWIWGIFFGILGLALLPLFVAAQPIILICLLVKWIKHGCNIPGVPGRPQSR